MEDKGSKISRVLLLTWEIGSKYLIILFTCVHICVWNILDVLVFRCCWNWVDRFPALPNFRGLTQYFTLSSQTLNTPDSFLVWNPHQASLTLWGEFAERITLPSAFSIAPCFSHRNRHNFCVWLSGLRRKKRRKRERKGRGCLPLSLSASLPPKKILSWENLFKWDHRSTAASVAVAVRHQSEGRAVTGDGGADLRLRRAGGCGHLFEWGGITHAETAADRHLLGHSRWGHCPHKEETGHVMVGYLQLSDIHSYAEFVLFM